MYKCILQYIILVFKNIPYFFFPERLFIATALFDYSIGFQFRKITNRKLFARKFFCFVRVKYFRNNFDQIANRTPIATFVL